MHTGRRKLPLRSGLGSRPLKNCPVAAEIIYFSPKDGTTRRLDSCLLSFCSKHFGESKSKKRLAETTVLD